MKDNRMIRLVIAANLCGCAADEQDTCATARRCDGVFECSDGSDERACTQATCRPVEGTFSGPTSDQTIEGCSARASASLTFRNGEVSLGGDYHAFTQDGCQIEIQYSVSEGACDMFEGTSRSFSADVALTLTPTDETLRGRWVTTSYSGYYDDFHSRCVIEDLCKVAQTVSLKFER